MGIVRSSVLLLGTKSRNMSYDHIAMSAILRNACFILSSPTLWKCNTKPQARVVINPNYLLTLRVGEEVEGQSLAPAFVALIGVDSRTVLLHASGKVL